LFKEAIDHIQDTDKYFKSGIIYVQN
jgi:uncharacterized membrane protein